MDKIMKELEKLGFSKIEALVYLTILENPKINGSQVAKKINCPRTTVYSGIEVLYKRGAITLIHETSNTYIANDPIEFIKKLKKEYIESAEFLEEEFKNFDNHKDKGEFYNLKGYKNTINKIKEMINSAQKEIYINTNYDLENFKIELQEAEKRKVRVILFTFQKQEFEQYPVEAYYNPKFHCSDDTKRVMIVIDGQIAFIGSGKVDKEFFGSFSYNKLFIQIVSEHIHHDIYLLGLEKLYGIQWYDKIKLGTNHELGL